LYGGPIIDAHCHLWDLGMNRHPWLRPTGGAIQALGDLAAIRRNYLVEDYRRDATNQNVIASVHVEASWDRAALSRLVSKGLSNTQGRSANRLNLLTPTSARRQV